MKTTRILQILLSFIVVSTIFSSCAPPDIKDLKLNNDTRMYAGEGEVCENPYIQLECAAGLECMIIASRPNIIKVCYPPGTKLQEDLVNRQLYDNENYAKGSKTEKNISIK